MITSGSTGGVQKDTRNNIWFVLLTTALIITWHLLFGKHFHEIYSQVTFYVGDIIIVAAYIYAAFRAIGQAIKGGADNDIEWLVWILPLLDLLWIGGFTATRLSA